MFASEHIWERLSESSRPLCLMQVFGGHAGDQLAEQPRGRHLAEDGRGCHLHSGGKGGDQFLIHLGF